MARVTTFALLALALAAVAAVFAIAAFIRTARHAPGEGQARTAPSSDKPTQPPPQLPVPSTTAEPTEAEQDLQVAASAFLSASLLATPLSPDARELKLAPTQLASLFAAAQQLPALRTHAATLAGKTFEMKLDPTAAASLASGDLQLMKSTAVPGAVRGNLIDADGTIRRQASWKQLAKAPAAAAAVWQVMAVVTAQKFLADIDRKLGELRRGIDDVTVFLEDERTGKLRGALVYLSNIAASLEQGDVDSCDAFVVQLEGIEKECLQIAEHLDRELERVAADVQAWAPPSDWENAIAQAEQFLKRHQCAAQSRPAPRSSCRTSKRRTTRSGNARSVSPSRCRRKPRTSRPGSSRSIRICETASES